jgi:LasA protease
MPITVNHRGVNDLMRYLRRLIFMLISGMLLAGCYQPGPGSKPWQASWHEESEFQAFIAEQEAAEINPTVAQIPVTTAHTPTPNPPITLPTPRTETVSYVVQPGDFLRKIAQAYQVSIEQIVEANGITNPNMIDVGQVLLIPPPSFEAVAPFFKIIPDSELVNSPGNSAFDVPAFVTAQGGYLASYQEEVDEVLLSGAAIVERVALDYSVNPRLLLAVLEFQSQWVTNTNPAEETLNYPLRYFDNQRVGLHRQLAWAANLLNEGYYRWKMEAISSWMLSDSTMIKVDPTINPGTAGVLNLVRYLTTQADWAQAVSERGIFSTYYQFFGFPFQYALEPLIADDLVQPELQLPFEDGVVWSFTGGPHGGWDSGSAWAGLDFAPPGEPRGCVPSDAWVVAVAPGEVGIFGPWRRDPGPGW